MKRKNNKSEYELVQERKQKYGCSGLCYGGKDENGVELQICGGIDTCDETRVQEGIASCLAALILIFTPVALVIGGVVLIALCIGGVI